MKQPPSRQAQATLAALAEMDRTGLARRWAEVFGCPAPRHSSVGLLRGALAWHCQMQSQAGTRTGGIERMVRTARRTATSTGTESPLAPGTQLLREWQGQTHHVTVLASGFEYGGKTYRSLTAITRQITCTAWSGPAFFGLRK